MGVSKNSLLGDPCARRDNHEGARACFAEHKPPLSSKRESDSQPPDDLVFGGLASNLFFYRQTPAPPPPGARVAWILNEKALRALWSTDAVIAGYAQPSLYKQTICQVVVARVQL